MRFAISIVAVLMILGLAAFGLESAQKMSASPSRTTAANSAAAAAPQGAAAQGRRDRVNPFSQIAQTTGEPASAPAAPMRSAEAIQAAASAVSNPPPARLAQPTAAAPPDSGALKTAPTATSIPPCDKSGGMGLSRVVEIDTTGGPGLGFEHFKQYDFLRDKEVVLTFDDGPWPGNTPAVIKALTDECLKATFFEIGEHATWHPEITKQAPDSR